MLLAAIGLLVAIGLSVPLWKVGGWRLVVPVALLLPTMGWFLSSWLTRDRCVEPGCGAVLPRSARVCPKCGGTIIGVLVAGRGPAGGDGD
jgi:hypothetical protein